jgi:hypothetical protein
LNFACWLGISSGPGPDWMSWIPNLVLPALGICIIIFSITGSRFGNSPQVFKGYGLDLQISPRTVFFLLGVGLSLTGVVIYFVSSERDIASLQKKFDSIQHELDATKHQLEQAKRQIVYVNMEFPAGPDPKNLKDIGDLKCQYYLNGELRDHGVTHGVSSRALSCPIVDVGLNDSVSLFVLIDATTGKTLAQANEDFKPLSPSIQLRPPGNRQ